MKTHRYAPATGCPPWAVCLQPARGSEHDARRRSRSRHAGLAGLTAVALLVLTSVPTQAEDAGVVRLGQSRASRATSETSTDTNAGTPVLRGQSPQSPPSRSQPDDALEWLRTAHTKSQPQPPQLAAGFDPSTCDACCPPQPCESGACESGACQPCPESCQHGYYGTGGPVCDGQALLHNNCFGTYLCGQTALHRAYMLQCSAGFNAYLRCKFGYFIHDGCGGAGCKPFGHYSVVYPVDPCYADARDGQVYAAQGVNGPVSVPLAPNVRHTYNYGWGVPSSRLTPVSHQSALR